MLTIAGQWGQGLEVLCQHPYVKSATFLDLYIPNLCLDTLEMRAWIQFYNCVNHGGVEWSEVEGINSFPILKNPCCLDVHSKRDHVKLDVNTCVCSVKHCMSERALYSTG